MLQPEYEYKGLMAEAWDVLRGDTSNWADRFYYLELIQKYGQPVLDVGCGTGRLLLDYTALGIEIDGVDNSPEMLALCRQKAVTAGHTVQLYEQYMENLSLPRRYRTILVPSSSFQLLLEPGQAAQAMQSLMEHLAPGGVIAASFMTLWRDGDPLESEWEKTAQRQSDGALFRRVAYSRYDPAIASEHTQDLYQQIVDGQVVAEELHQRSPATRSYTQAEARALFEQAGLVRVELYREFTFEPVNPDDTLFTVCGQLSEE